MPLPSPFLFPSPFLLPGGPGPFSDLLLASTSPWSDPSGFWDTYNAALATMFEPVYDIVADQGDVEQTIVATLSNVLSTSAAITSIPVQSVSQPVTSGQIVTLSFGQSAQILTILTSANVGDTAIGVSSFTPNFSYPIGTPVQLEYIPGWSTLLDPVNCPDQFLPFLAQFNGTDIPVGLDAPTARTKIAGESAQHRGTLASVVSAVQRNLTGTQSVVILERVDAIGNVNAYWFVIVVRPEEVINVLSLTDAVNTIKPGGVQWTLVQTDGWTISQMEASAATIAILEGNFVTLTGLEGDRVGH